MIYKILDISDIAVSVQVSEFAAGDGVREYNVIIETNDPKLSAERQIANLEAAADKAIAGLGQDVSVVFKRYFLSDPANQAPLLPKGQPCAMSVIGQPPLNGTKAALWMYAQTGMQVSPLSDGLWQAVHGKYRHIWAGNRTVPDVSSELATTTLLFDYSTLLEDEGCRLLDNCMRTWFFVRDIDVNYRGVVIGRNDVFRSTGLRPETHFIASTGIAGTNADQRACVTMDAYAIDGICGEQVTYLHASDFLNPTIEYGVAFERGAAIDYGDRRHVLISGTASINNKGEVMYPGDIRRQADRMIENVEALVNEGACEMTDLTHIIVYLRDIADYDVVSEIFDERFGEVPHVIVQAPVCRPGWLIEMESMAIKGQTNPRFAPL